MVIDAAQQPAEGDIHFPGMDPAEEFRFYFRRHWIRPARHVTLLVLWMLAFAGIAFLSGVLSMEDAYTRHAFTIILCVFFVLPHIIFITKLYKHFMSIVIVTDKKVHQFKRTLVAVDRHESVDLWVLQDIAKIQRGIIQNILGFGSLKLEAQNSRITIHFIPNINDIHNKIVQLREAARGKMLPVQREQPLPVQPS